METMDGINGLYPNMMWDVTRAYCTEFLNCPDQTARECLALHANNGGPYEDPFA